tara:strand:- start:33 stop:149 length:117 start_codon:yes stop_codon:yes gene_type:complete
VIKKMGTFGEKNGETGYSINPSEREVISILGSNMIGGR